MFKLVVLSAVLAVVAAAPAPGFLHGAPAAIAVAAPLATSHTSRIDIHSAPIIAAAPVIHAAPYIAAAPAIAVAHSAPVIAAVPAAVSHQHRVDIHHSPIAHIAAAPVISVW